MNRWHALFLLSFMVYVNGAILSASFFLQSNQSDKMLPLIQEIDYESCLNKIEKNKYSKIATLSSEKRDFLLKTPSGISVSMTFYDRGSKHVIIFGQGFLGKRASGERIADLFPDYDVVLFDYRWARIVNFLLKLSTLFHPIEKFLLEEDEEVLAVVRFVTSKKQYEQVIGLAQCYSCFTFAKAHYVERCAHRQLFTKLIFDSCWYSFHDLGEQMIKNPILSTNFQVSEIPHELEKIVQSDVLHSAVDSMLRMVVPEVSIAYYLSQICNTPMLFIHGIDDRVVPFKTVFSKIWDSVVTDKAGFITPRAHARNSDDHELYAYMCGMFIRSHSINEFLGDARNLCKM